MENWTPFDPLKHRAPPGFYDVEAQVLLSLTENRKTFLLI